jgi:predicted protein tyrosine phosphatase
MKCLSIVGRKDVRDTYLDHKPDCIVSIKDIIRDWEKPAKNFYGEKLLLEFEDWENDMDGSPQIVHIQQIIAFGEKNVGKTFVVNCEAGISRSSATALILQHIGGKSIEANFEDLTERFQRIYPNGKMLKMASNILDKELWYEYLQWENFWRDRMNRRMYSEGL